MAALREGLTMLRFSGDTAIREKLIAMGAAFMPAADAVLDLLGHRRPEHACALFLQQD